MKILFKREQTSGRVLDVQFKLWAKIELDEDEKALVDRYRFTESVLIFGPEPKLIRRAAFMSIGIALVVLTLLGTFVPTNIAVLFGLAAGGGFGYWYYNEKREKLFVKDLLHGRTFTCPGIIELTKKEAWLHDMSSILRQVLETAKHWGGTETNDIPALEPAQARNVVIQFG